MVVVNHEFAEHFWPHQDPIGKRMRVGTQKVNTPWMTVVGEVADARLFSRDADAKKQFYQPAAQLEKSIGPYASPRDLIGNEGYIVLRSSIPPEKMENSLRASVRSLDPELPLSNVQSMEKVVSRIEAPRRFNTIIVSGFASAAIVLAFLGIYSVIAFSVAARVQEMAIRVALGSQPSGIMRLILLSGIKLAATGTVIGVAGAGVASNLLRSFLFSVSPFDPVIMILAAVVILSLALIASALPARRAASVHPMEALRGD